MKIYCLIKCDHDGQPILGAAKVTGICAIEILDKYVGDLRPFLVAIKPADLATLTSLKEFVYLVQIDRPADKETVMAAVAEKAVTDKLSAEIATATGTAIEIKPQITNGELVSDIVKMFNDYDISKYQLGGE